MAAHFHALSNTQKGSYDHLIENLKAAICPAVCKMLYADFTARLLYNKEDTVVYLHSIRELLDKANPTLSAAAKEALLGRQFLTGLPVAVRLKLLEHNPTPKLCGGGGKDHFPQQCADNWTVKNVPSNYANASEVSVPLNYEGVLL